MTFQEKFLILCLTLLILGCKRSEITIKYDEESRYENIDKAMIADKSKESVTVFFESYFNGLVKAHIGNKLVFNKKIETDESLGTTSDYLFYDYSKNKKLPIIKITSVDNTVEVEVKKEYKLIYVNNHNDKWEIIYSNVYPTYE